MSSNNFFTLLLKEKSPIKQPFLNSKVISLFDSVLFLAEGCIFSTTEKKNTIYVVTGKLHNRNALINIISAWEPKAYLFNDAEILLTLQEMLGVNAIKLAEGDYCMITASPLSPVSIISAPHGSCSVHIVTGNHHWITNCLRSITTAEGSGSLSFICEKTLAQSECKQENFTPVTNANRLRPGVLHIIDQDSEGFVKIDSNSAYWNSNVSNLNLSSERLTALIDQYLNAPLCELSFLTDSVGIPLSGGLDSSLITALAVTQFTHVRTYSIGTEISNEFQYAQCVSEVLGTTHTSQIISEQEVITGIVESIYYNEIFDGLSAEIQSGLFNVYRLAKGQVSAMITGYGSDLLFGGILTPGKDYSSPNQLLASEVYRTRWTGEFSTNGAGNYGIDIRHPFWTNNLITLCKNLNPYHKTRDNEVKNILREFTHKLGTLPELIINRKKIGIHEGSSVNKAFADILGSKTDDYNYKNIFTYRLYKSFFRNESDINSLSHDKLKTLMLDGKIC